MELRELHTSRNSGCTIEEINANDLDEKSPAIDLRDLTTARQSSSYVIISCNHLSSHWKAVEVNKDARVSCPSLERIATFGIHRGLIAWNGHSG